MSLLRSRKAPPTPDVRHVDATARHEHLLTGPTGTWAWYRLGPVRWFYTDSGYRDATLRALTGRASELVGLRLHLRMTSEEFSWKTWAEQVYGRYADTALPDHDGAPTRVDRLVETQEAIARAGKQNNEPVAYLGVRITTSTLTSQQLRETLERGPVKDKTAREVRERLRAVTASVSQDGTNAHPLSAPELERLIHKSVALHVPTDPTSLTGVNISADWEVPLDAAAASSVQVTAEPYAPHVEIHALRGGKKVTRCVSVLTVQHIRRRARLTGTPWMAYLARVNMPVEVSAVFDVIPGKEARPQAEATRRRAEHVRDHYTKDHEERPPHRVMEGIEDAFRIEGEVNNTEEREVSTRLAGPIRVAVAGADPDEVAVNVRELTNSAYEDVHLTLTHDVRQYARFHEFTPGNLHEIADFARIMPAYFFATALPNAANQLGEPGGTCQRHGHDGPGFYMGPIVGGPGSHFHDPHWGPRHNEPGLQTITSTLGGGKSVTAGVILYESTCAGIRSVGFAPGGDWVGMQHLPELRGHVEVIDMASAKPGSIIPHSLVPEVQQRDYPSMDLYLDAVREAEADRKDYLIDALAIQLPPGFIADNSGVVPALEAAVDTVGGAFGTNPWRAIDALRREGDFGARLAGMLEATSRNRGAALMWPEDRNADAVRGMGDSTATLTIITMKDLVTPPPGVAPEHWNRSERSSRMPMYLGSRFATRILTTHRGPKVIVTDEAGITAGSTSAWQSFMVRASRTSRANEGAVYVLGQNPRDAHQIDPEFSNLLGGGWVGRIKDPQIARVALSNVGIPADEGYERVVTERLRTGEFLRRDWHGNVERYRQYVPPRLLEVIQTTPQERAAKAAMYGVMLGEEHDYARRFTARKTLVSA